MRGAVAYAGRDSGGDVVAGGVLTGDSTPLYTYTSPPPLNKSISCGTFGVSNGPNMWTIELIREKQTFYNCWC